MMVSYVQEYMHEITLVHPHSRIVLVLARFISGAMLYFYIYIWCDNIILFCLCSCDSGVWLPNLHYTLYLRMEAMQ